MANSGLAVLVWKHLGWLRARKLGPRMANLGSAVLVCEYFQRLGAEKLGPRIANSGPAVLVCEYFQRLGAEKLGPRMANSDPAVLVCEYFQRLEAKKPSTRRTRGCHLTGKAHDPPQTRESRKRGLSVALARLLLFLGLEGSSFTHSELVP